MKINAITFKNFNHNIHKRNSYQTRPMSLKTDSVEFSKNISFKANLTSEEEIYEIDKHAIALSRFVLSEMSSITESAKDELKQAQDIWQNIQPILKNSDKNHLTEYREDGTNIEITQDNASVIYKSYSEPDSPNKYDEWVFNLAGKLRSVSKGVITTDDTEEIDCKYFFVNDKLDELQRGIKEEKGRSVKINSESSFINGRLLRHCEGVVISQNYTTYIKEKLHFNKNESLYSYIQEELSGDNWSTSAHEIIYNGSLIAQYRKGRFSNSTSEGDEQLSWFKNGKLYTTRGQGY